MKHENDGACAKCQEIFDKYPGFYLPLRWWFSLVQLNNPAFHCAEAGRGKIEQEILFAKGRSRARWGQSAHNANIAFDSFFLVDGQYSLDRKLYESIEPEIPDFISWYGSPRASFPEVPHFECKGWKKLLAIGDVRLVE